MRGCNPGDTAVPFYKTRTRTLLNLGGLLMALGSLPAMAQTFHYTGSIASVAPQTAISGKLATRTEIVADRGLAAMLTPGSEEALAGAIAMYEEIVAGGGWPELPPKKLSKGAKGPHVETLRQRLVAEGYLPFDSLNAEPADVYDDEIVAAVKAFQINHGVAPTGAVGERTLAELNITAEARLFTLHENWPRISTYMQNLGPRYILVNIPSAQLETVEQGRVFSRHNIVAGKLDRPSPTLASTVSDIVFNPFWIAPASIVERDILPKYFEDPTYLDQMNMRILDGVDGPEIDPATVDWAMTAPDRYVFRQDPGDNNALATVKINFPNTHMVYMHDTPYREMFGGNARYESSGCVRIDQVSTVVNWILDGQDGFNNTRYELLTASGEPYKMNVQNPPDVRWMYLTAWATEDGAVNFRPDIYGLDGSGFILGQPEPRGF